jgi:3-isopropylmalate dehydrogenase
LLLDISFGLKEESETIIKAVEQTLKQGWRTTDIADTKTPKEKILNTQKMGSAIINEIEKVASHKLSVTSDK